MKRKIIVWVVFLAAAQALSAAVAPSIVELSTPYPLLKSLVRFGGVSYAPGSVPYGPVGTPLVIRGANFGSSGTVAFIGTQRTTRATVSYTGSDGANISIMIPANATTGTIVVTTSSESSNAAPILVTFGVYSASCSVTVLPPAPPVIAGLTPSSGPSGTLVTITGTGFGVSSGTATIGSLTATIVSWKANSIIAWVPTAVPANTLAVVQIMVENQSSNAVGFSVTGSPGVDPICQLTQ